MPMIATTIISSISVKPRWAPTAIGLRVDSRIMTDSPLGEAAIPRGGSSPRLNAAHRTPGTASRRSILDAISEIRCKHGDLRDHAEKDGGRSTDLFGLPRLTLAGTPRVPGGRSRQSGTRAWACPRPPAVTADSDHQGVLGEATGPGSFSAARL